MTRHGPVLLALSALAIAGWTYNVNYDTRAALDRIEALRMQIAEEREALQVLRVEWAWLNAPDRLGRLVAAHNDRLGLMPLKPEAFGIVAAAPYPKDAPWAPEVPPAAPEMLVASTGGVPAADIVLATRAEEIVEGSAQEALVEAVAEKAEVLADGGLADGGQAEGGVVEGTQVADGTLAPAGVLTGGQAAPATMQDAVTLALIEAGVVQPAAVAAVLPAAAGAIPVPPARPAVWARR